MPTEQQLKPDGTPYRRHEKGYLPPDHEEFKVWNQENGEKACAFFLDWLEKDGRWLLRTGPEPVEGEHSLTRVRSAFCKWLKANVQQTDSSSRLHDWTIRAVHHRFKRMRFFCQPNRRTSDSA